MCGELEVGMAKSGTVGGDDAGPAPAGDGIIGVMFQPGTGRSMEIEYGLAVWIAVLGVVLHSSKTVNKGTPPMPSVLLRSAPHPRLRSAVELQGCNLRCSLDLFSVGKGLAR